MNRVGHPRYLGLGEGKGDFLMSGCFRDTWRAVPGCSRGGPCAGYLFHFDLRECCILRPSLPSG